MDQCDRVVAVVRELLGETVVGIYLHGSAIIGGLKPTSDIDILVLINRPMTPDERRELIGRLLPISGRRNLSSPVRHPVVEITEATSPLWSAG